MSWASILIDVLAAGALVYGSVVVFAILMAYFVSDQGIVGTTKILASMDSDQLAMWIILAGFWFPLISIAGAGAKASEKLAVWRWIR